MKNNFLKTQLHRLKADYRHIICWGLTAISLAFGFFFPNSLPRLGEALRDVVTSLSYYVYEIFDLDFFRVYPTVMKMPEWKFTEQIWQPLQWLPYTLEEFKILLDKFWTLFFDEENFEKYWFAVGDFLYYFSRFSLILAPLVGVLAIKLNNIKNKRYNGRSKKSKPLKRFEAFLFKCIYPVIAWIKSFVDFLKENKNYCKIWMVLWCFHFHIFSIVVSFVAFYLYFSASWNVPGIYTQLLKLQSDLAPMVRFIPVFIWLIFFIWLYNYVCRSMAFSRLYYYEKSNRAFLRERGVTTVAFGPMGIGKTQFVTSLALSAEIEQFDQAFQIMLDKDIMFPNFPWERFRNDLKRRIDNRDIVDIPSCRAFVRRRAKCFERIVSRGTFEEWQNRPERYKKIFDHTYGYDYTHYPTTYNDELKITKLFEAIEDYACAYLIFTVKTTLLFANYSIRVDSIIKDLGNMPLRDNDFFKRSPERQEAYSRHAHIIDFDMLRLGKKMLEDNPKARRLSFGVYVITEIDKERKNMNELKETKIKVDEVNQKNDLFNACLMMSRHAAVVDNKVFIRFIMDLQRPEAWGAGGRELGEVIYISEKDDLNPLLPILSPYWLINPIFEFIKGKWNDFYSTYIYNRSDNILFAYLCKNIVSKINNHYDKVKGLFGCQTLKLEIQSGTLEGEPKKDKWRLLMKKDRSKRYQTACLESVFESYKPNTMHVDDFISYAGAVGTSEENALQNSYFQDDIHKMRNT